MTSDGRSNREIRQGASAIKPQAKHRGRISAQDALGLINTHLQVGVRALVQAPTPFLDFPGSLENQEREWSVTVAIHTHLKVGVNET